MKAAGYETYHHGKRGNTSPAIQALFDHNKYVVDRFTSQGVRFVDSLSEVPVGAYLLYSAHGVSPEVQKAAATRR